MSSEDVINFIDYSVNHYDTINLRVINNEDEGYVMNKDHPKTHDLEIRVLVSGVSTTGKPILDIGPKPVSIKSVIFGEQGYVKAQLIQSKRC